MKKIIALVIALALVLTIPFIMSRPSFGDKNTFLSKARSDNIGNLRLYIYDGELIKTMYLEDREVIAEMLDEFASYRAKRAKDWSPEMVSLPIYSFSTQMDNDIAGFWSNGYWVTPSGKAYTLNCDIDALVDYFPSFGYSEYPVSESYITLADFSCSRFFCQNGDTWVKNLLSPSNYFDSFDGAISAEVKSYSGKEITIEIKNNGDNTENVSTSFENISVLLDGVWYIIPYMPGIRMGSPAEKLDGNSLAEATLDLSLYGDLPPGEYRAESYCQWSVPFTVE